MLIFHVTNLLAKLVKDEDFRVVTFEHSDGFLFDPQAFMFLIFQGVYSFKKHLSAPNPR